MKYYLQYGADDDEQNARYSQRPFFPYCPQYICIYLVLFEYVPMYHKYGQSDEYLSSCIQYNANGE